MEDKDPRHEPEALAPTPPVRVLSVSEAAALYNFAEDRLRRRLDAGGVPGAYRSGANGNAAWLIPEPSLIALGYAPAVEDSVEGTGAGVGPAVVDLNPDTPHVSRGPRGLGALANDLRRRTAAAELAGEREDQQTELATERDALIAERDKLAAERDELAVDRDELLVDRDELEIEAETLAAALHDTRLALEEASKTSSVVQESSVDPPLPDAERLAAEASFEALEAYRVALEAETAALDARRRQIDDRAKALAADRRRFTAETKNAKVEAERLAVEGDELAAQRDELVAERAAVKEEGARLAAQREELATERAALEEEGAQLVSEAEELDAMRRRVEEEWLEIRQRPPAAKAAERVERPVRGRRRPPGPSST